MPRAPAQPVAIAPAASAGRQPSRVPAPAPTVLAPQPPASIAPERVAGRQDTMTVTLRGQQRPKVKLTMNRTVSHGTEWASAGGASELRHPRRPFNAPKNFYHGYGKGVTNPGDRATRRCV